ncbi:lipopolysaccharide export system permease protein [Bacteroides luti]|uniref:Lipopolysaccharide export system permease protein n=1 Tax=Bacteroides luti TaxID=1297750 RepID=A0A1M5G3X2_9BACE|nr:LptF/LptG family permease [Bacteroides luti]SHF98409.1 lipopolysaccharide export system permease protein [Bacteroides luti]
MLRIKKLDIFVIKSFTLLFFGTFFICLFIFMMQFLWRYVDDLVGKGLAISVLSEFFFYAILTLVPTALPLAILLASLMTFGNFGERYELLAIKAAGISLIRVMAPLIVFTVFLCSTSFYFQNVVAPKAQVKLFTLLFSMKQKSPELEIPEGVFYDEIEGYNLYVKHKNKETGALYNIMIYNFSDGFDNAHIIVADSGKLEMTADKKYLRLHLYSGEMFENLKSQSSSMQNVPYRRESFSEKHTIIDFNSNFNMIDESFMNNQYQSKNMTELQTAVDSMNHLVDSVGKTFYKEAVTSTYRFRDNFSKEDTLKIRKAKLAAINTDSVFNNLSLSDKQKAVANALSTSQSIGNDWKFKSFNTVDTDKRIRRHEMEWHKKIALSISCLIFFFIGAPLGGIIRKGGLGMPVVISILIFLIYYIIDTTGAKMARNGTWVIWTAMWISTFILAPVGIFLSYKSNNDSVVLNVDTYINWLRKVIGIRDTRHLAKKEVIIEDPDYLQEDKNMELLNDMCEEYISNNRLKRAPNYFTIWTKNEKDEEIVAINEQLEVIIEKLANTKNTKILGTLNNYPILSVHAHRCPFNMPSLNKITGIILPIGLIYYFRIWAFRVRLYKDLKLINKVNRDLQDIIRTICNK